jgi:hypothetical protein
MSRVLLSGCKPVALRGCLKAISFLGQTNFAKAPPIKVALRFQPFGFDECFDPVCDKVLVQVHWHLERDRDVTDDAGNLKELRPATREDDLID